MAKREKPAPGTRGLDTYHARRRFDRTPEPRGDTTARSENGSRGDRRFCVQKHLASHLHYDFRLEHGGVLLSWAVPKGPSLNPRDKRLAMQTEDHPLDYGDFEGVIPEGYGAGVVLLWDKGTWRPEEGFEDVDAALARGELKFTLDGYKLKGSWVLVRTRGGYGRRGGGERDAARSWLLIKHRDGWAGELDVTQVAPLSIVSEGDFADVLAQASPNLWQSHRPAEGGQAGAAFRKIIRRAQELRDARTRTDDRPRKATTKRVTKPTPRRIAKKK